jgi:hypothetical protein
MLDEFNNEENKPINKKKKAKEIKEFMKNVDDDKGLSKSDFFKMFKKDLKKPKYAELLLPNGKKVNVDILDVKTYSNLYEDFEMQFAILNTVYHQMIELQKKLISYEIKDPNKLKGKEGVMYNLLGLSSKIKENNKKIEQYLFSKDIGLDSNLNKNEYKPNVNGPINSSMEPQREMTGSLAPIGIQKIAEIKDPDNDFIFSSGLAIPEELLHPFATDGDGIYQEIMKGTLTRFAIFGGTMFLVDNKKPFIYTLIEQGLV